jgi:hypothetical protein
MLLSTNQYPQPEDHMSDNPTAVTAAALEVAFGHHWAVWLSDTGTWWAARTASLTAEQLTSGCVPFLRADDPDELATGIRDQNALTSLGHDAACPHTSRLTRRTR